MRGFLLVTVDTSSNSQNLHWYGSLHKRSEPPALFPFLTPSFFRGSYGVIFNFQYLFSPSLVPVGTTKFLCIQRINGKSGKGCFLDWKNR